MNRSHHQGTSPDAGVNVGSHDISNANFLPQIHESSQN